jgi:hypothetical protein
MIHRHPQFTVQSFAPGLDVCCDAEWLLLRNPKQASEGFFYAFSFHIGVAGGHRFVVISVFSCGSC